MAEIALLEGLNTEQKDAVTHAGGPLLIIAGAGTGKTTVITRRIAHLISDKQIPADHILALTFTEKAAGEMEERVESLLPMGYVDLWISTFHSFCERILKDHALDVGLSNDFRLLSETEQWLLLREHIDEFELDYYRPKGNPTKFVQALISHFSRLKDEDITPQTYLEFAQQLQLDTDAELPTGKKKLSHEQKAMQDEAQRVMEVANAYARYQQLLRDNNALDFGDLIVETIHLFQQRPALLERYRQQFEYVLVDEFQDTNYAQYDLIKLLAAPHNNLTVVADDDQSIYRFRGASMSNILTFKKEFADAAEVSLVQNYRSTQDILDLAYAFIQNNNPERLEERFGISKRLKSNNQSDGLIEHLHSESLEGEAKLVIDTIAEAMKQNRELSWNDFAILVRANSEAQTFIPYLERAGIPYQFLASRGLFAKSIIIDVVAFLNLLDNYHESRALYRVLSYDVWNIPAQDIMAISRHAHKSGESLYESCRSVRSVAGLEKETYTTVDSMFTLVESLTRETKYKSAGEIILQLLEQSGYLKRISELETATATEQILYLNQFYKYVEAFERASIDKSVHSFVREMNMMLEAGEEGRLRPDFDEGPESVKILTVHAAKGLEFEYVFVVNLVDKRFPSIGRKEAIAIPDGMVKEVLPEGDWHLQEERRLFYVALTRAKTHLYLTSGEDYGGARKKKPSRFLVEAGFVDTVPQPTGEVLFGQQPVLPEKQAEAERTQLPSSFSFTQLQAFQTCPWQYRFAFLLKVPVPGKPSFSFGKTIHNTLYEFFRGMKEQSEFAQGGLFDSDSSRATFIPTLDTLLDIYEKKWINEWYPSKKLREEYHTKGKKALKQFYALHEQQWPNVLYLEQGFTLKLGDYTIKGAIDRVDQTEAGVAVVDYKTGSFPKSGKKDVEQLYLYALALRQVFELEPVKLSYYFIEDNKAIEEELKEKKMESVAEWALGMIQKITTGEIKPTPGRHCTYCDYRDICEYRAV